MWNKFYFYIVGLAAGCYYADAIATGDCPDFNSKVVFIKPLGIITIPLMVVFGITCLVFEDYCVRVWQEKSKDSLRYKLANKWNTSKFAQYEFGLPYMCRKLVDENHIMARSDKIRYLKGMLRALSVGGSAENAEVVVYRGKVQTYLDEMKALDIIAKISGISDPDL